MLTAQLMGQQARGALEEALTHRKIKPRGKLGFRNQYFILAIWQAVYEKPYVIAQTTL